MSITTSIRKMYLEGKPLSSAQRHYLWFNHHKLGYEFERMAKYYQLTKKAESQRHSFINPRDILSSNDIQAMHRRLELMLASVKNGIELKFTPAQFLALKNAIGELIFYHGNQVLTGAPFFAGGVSRVDFFQWGNLLGVVKYEELLSEKGVEGNFLIHFEGMKDRTILQSIQDYQRHQHQTLQQQAHLNPQSKEVTAVYTAPRPRFILQPSWGHTSY